MSLHNILDSRNLKFLIANLLLMGSLPVQASVIYNFTSAPISVGAELGGFAGTRVVTVFGPLGPVGVGFPQTASLTFESPLAASSNIQLSAEIGGFDFIGGPNQGGLEAYSAPEAFPEITSDINDYLIDFADPFLTIQRYSSLSGQVTTDAAGNIAAWDLTFDLYFDVDAQFVIDTAANTIDGVPSLIGTKLQISSDPASPQTFLGVVELNGVAQPPSNFNFNGADTLFVDTGDLQYRYYTEQPGSFEEPPNQVPAPNTLLLLLAALLGWRLVVFSNPSRLSSQLS